MRPQNLLSVYQGAEALENFDIPAEKKIKRLKRHEIRNLHSFCNEMLNAGCHLPDLDGFFVGYTIQQIGKEFDLLRFGENFNLNIELKSELKIANKADKIEKQLKTNHYYLKFLGKSLRLFSYVENDGYYEYVDNSLIKTNAEAIAACMHNQVINYIIFSHNKSPFFRTILYPVQFLKCPRFDNLRLCIFSAKSLWLHARFFPFL